MSFHAIDGLQVQEQQAANVRVFTGDGTPFLKVPGCKEVKSVRLGNLNLPMVISQRFPLSADGKEHVTVDSPMVSLQNMADGTPVLLRNQQSNDGFWQKDVPVFVQGEWEEETKKSEAGSRKAEAKADAAAPVS